MSNTEQEPKEPREPRYKSAARSSLPLNSVIDDQELMTESTLLLKKAVALQSRISKDTDDLKEIRERLAVIAQTYEIKGFRHGLVGFEYHGYTSRKSLSKEKLLEHGVTAAQIGDSYVEGEPYLNTRIVVFDVE